MKKTIPASFLFSMLAIASTLASNSTVAQQELQSGVCDDEVPNYDPLYATGIFFCLFFACGTVCCLGSTTTLEVNDDQYKLLTDNSEPGATHESFSENEARNRKHTINCNGAISIFCGIGSLAFAAALIAEFGHCEDFRLINHTGKECTVNSARPKDTLNSLSATSFKSGCALKGEFVPNYLSTLYLECGGVGGEVQLSYNNFMGHGFTTPEYTGEDRTVIGGKFNKINMGTCHSTIFYTSSFESERRTQGTPSLRGALEK